MATVTHRVSTASTTNATSYASGSFTPGANELLVVLVIAGATADAGVVTNSQGITFTKVDHAVYRSSNDRCYIFVADSLASAVSQTVTFACAGDQANGAVILVAGVSGMTLLGASAIRQSAKQENGAAAGTPAPAFGAACLTGNPTLGVMGNGANPAGMTPPGSWNEGADTGYNTPASGAEYVHRNSGFTGTTVTWGSSSGTAFGALIVELDSSAPVFVVPKPPIVAPSQAVHRAASW